VFLIRVSVISRERLSVYRLIGLSGSIIAYRSVDPWFAEQWNRFRVSHIQEHELATVLNEVSCSPDNLMSPEQIGT
jgi:hypothetical protein